MMSPPESPIASKARSPGSPKASFRRLGSTTRRNLASLWPTNNNLEDAAPDDDQDADAPDTLFSPKYESEEMAQMQLNFDDDMVVYHHLKMLTEYRRKIYSGPNKLPAISDPDKYTLVLDLDETLVHCSTDAQIDSDAEFNLQFNGVSFNVAARFRPFLTKFLDTVSKWYEIVIFTASQQVYADRVIAHFDHKNRITHRLYRDDCTNVCGNFIKDLSVLGRDLKKTIFIDNSPQAFAYHISNSIPIVSWYSDEDDKELEKLIRILEEIRHCDDVREYITEAFRIQELLDSFPENYHPI